MKSPENAMPMLDGNLMGMLAVAAIVGIDTNPPINDNHPLPPKK